MPRADRRAPLRSARRVRAAARTSELRCSFLRLPHLLAVTLLTSLEESDLRRLGYRRNLSLLDIVYLRTDIAQEAGCAVGLAYRYFASKDELVAMLQNQ